MHYLVGGKSSAIDWDSWWGRLTKVTAAGDSSTGTYRSFGLDCTGLIDWSLRNAGLHSDGNWYIGSNLTEVSQTAAQPGDITLNNGASHVGIIVGRDSSGKLLVCHCSYGQNAEQCGGNRVWGQRVCHGGPARYVSGIGHRILHQFEGNWQGLYIGKFDVGPLYA